MNTAAPPPLQTTTAPLAIVSLVAGLLGITLMPFLGSLVAIVAGHLARRDIRRNPNELHGDNLALVGLILGWFVVVTAVLCVIAFLSFFGGLAWLGYHFS